MAPATLKKMKQRTEPVNDTYGTEFSVVNTGNRVRQHELLLSLGDELDHADLRKQIKLDKKRNKVLPTPLPKAEEEKIKRSLQYEHVSEDISKWDNVVQHNRLAEHASYPLKQSEIRLVSAVEATKRYKPKTELELEIDAILNENKTQAKKQSRQVADEVSLEEALLRRQEIQKMRAQQSYLEAKAYRRNKIKSKQYRQILKKERMKKEVKEFEDLLKTDPEAATEKLSKVQKDRVLERMTLKHRGTTKWAKQLQTRAKHDLDARSSLAQQILISKQLTQKTEDKNSESETEEEEMEMTLEPGQSEGEISPWLVYKKNETEGNNKGDAKLIQEGYMKVWNEVRQEVENKKGAKKDAPNKGKESHELEEEAIKVVNETVKKVIKEKNNKLTNGTENDNCTQIKKKQLKTSSKKLENVGEKNQSRKRPKIEDMEEGKCSKKKKKKQKSIGSEVIEQEDITKDENQLKLEIMSEGKSTQTGKEKVKPKIKERVNRKKFTNSYKNEKRPKIENIEVDFEYLGKQVKRKVLSSDITDLILNENDLDDEDRTFSRNKLALAEAFADDDVVVDFQKEKEAIVEKNQPEDINLLLPGWGQWAGGGLAPSEKRKEKYTIKAPRIPRKDDWNGNVIINEGKDKKIARLQVNQVPFPFTNAVSFENSLQAPLGKNWNTETAFRKLTKPKVEVKLGSIVEPIDKESLVKKQKPAFKWRVEDDDKIK